MNRFGKIVVGILFAVLVLCAVPVSLLKAQVTVSAPSVILVEASTGQVIYEQNATERRTPASITKIMTLLLTFDQLEAGKLALTDEISVSEYASSMGGSQVFLDIGEIQTLETMIKCIAVSSANDASVAVAEHIAGSEEAFVGMMNERAAGLGMSDTHFVDCCGLTDSDEHYTSAKDVAIMSRELITKHPKIFDYTQIWMEDITHVTRQGTSNFTLSSTNKLLKQYQWTTGLKTGYTSKAKYCISATASKNNIDLIAVVMAASDSKLRNQDAQTLLNYGFSICDLYTDENTNLLPDLSVDGGVEKTVPIVYAGEFRYLDTTGNSLSQIEKKLDLPERVSAPVFAGEEAGCARYYLNGQEIGSTPVLFGKDIAKAGYRDYLKKIFLDFLL